MSLSWLRENFHYIRYSLGISMMINGFPIIFFVRDTLHVGPASNVFSAAFFAFAIILMIPANWRSNLYVPNKVLLAFGLCFMGILVAHFYYMNPMGRSVADYGYFLFFFAFILLLCYVPNDVTDVLLIVIFATSMLSNLTLVYSLLTDPNWFLGMRAAVSFANEGAQAGGNPHISARNSLFCLLSAYLLMRKHKGVLVTVFLIISCFFTIGLLILAQSKTCLLGTLMAIGFHMVLTFRPKEAIRSIPKLFTRRNLSVIALMCLIIMFFLNRYRGVLNTVAAYWSSLGDRMNNTFFTAFGVRTSESVSEDASAMGRVTSFQSFFEDLSDPVMVLFGKGYKMEFMDVPLLEMWANHGLIGFIIFGGLNFFLFLYSVREIYRQGNEISLLSAYFFIQLIVLLVASGRPTDIAYWYPYAFMIRFLGIRYLPKQNPLKQNQLRLQPAV